MKITVTDITLNLGYTMAKKAMIERDKKRQRLVEKHENLRNILESVKKKRKIPQ